MKKIKIIGFSLILISFIVGNLIVDFSFKEQEDTTIKLIVSQSIANSEDYGNGRAGSCYSCYSSGQQMIYIQCFDCPTSSCTETSCGGGFC